ncbi:MAG: hypothetical protein DRG39_04965, partial [Deltaproteobacteria bacterium]
FFWILFIFSFISSSGTLNPITFFSLNIFFSLLKVDLYIKQSFLATYGYIPLAPIPYPLLSLGDIWYKMEVFA